jgi:hypothetical protein
MNRVNEEYKLKNFGGGYGSCRRILSPPETINLFNWFPAEA